MGVQSLADVNADLQAAYAARRAALSGKSFTLQTSAGMRTITRQDLGDLQKMIDRLERRVASGGNTHNFAVANFNNDIDR